MASRALQQLFNDTDWGLLDYLIVDMPPGTGDIQLTMAQQLPVTGAVVVTTPQNVALKDAEKGVGSHRSMYQLRTSEPSIDVQLRTSDIDRCTATYV